ncbi:MAG: hypothetical protein M0Q14_08305, partial [Tissierellaceae bacterium]|nr:hypothetical protein [Tissierellaceae bacterium]
MSNEKERLQTGNDYATERVPLNERKSIASVALVASGFCIAMSGLFTGAAMAAGLNVKQALIAAFRVAKSHVDGICLESSVWLDGVQILDEGKYVHPELKELARKLG